VAVDVTAKALGIAAGVSDASDRLMEALEDFQALSVEAADSGIDFAAANGATTAINAALEASSLKHMDAAMVAAALNSGTALAGLLAAAQIAHRRNFQKVRP
jgi:hypothetical protein